MTIAQWTLITGLISFRSLALTVPALECHDSSLQLFSSSKCGEVEVCDRIDGLPILIAAGYPGVVLGEIQSLNNNGSGCPSNAPAAVRTNLISSVTYRNAARVYIAADGMAGSLSVRSALLDSKIEEASVRYKAEHSIILPGCAGLSYCGELPTILGKRVRIVHRYQWIVTAVNKIGCSCPFSGQASYYDGGVRRSSAVLDVVSGAVKIKLTICNTYP